MSYLLKKLREPILLLPICLIAYLPLSSFLFALKNDAFIFNFPNKFFFSEALKQGYLPLWNPYLNFGFPIYADPGFAWWQPITWLFGIIGYNAYTFTIEVLLYIYIAGLGMYWLGKKLNFKNATSFLIGCMFMCCGFFIGNLQHINFLTCAAFLPWTIGTWLIFQLNPTFKKLLLHSLSVYLLCTSGHPAIPLATFYFFILLTCLFILLNKKIIQIKPFLLNQLKLIGTNILILSPIIISYLIVLPYYTRSEPVNQLESSNVGFTLSSYISFLSPFATIKNTDFFRTDISMRNAYFSLCGIVFFMLSLIKKRKTISFQIFLTAGILMLFLSAGGITKKLLYEHLPGLNFIRTNGEFRVFSILCFIICSGYTIDEYFVDRKLLSPTLRQVSKWLLIISCLACISFLYPSIREALQWKTEISLIESIKFGIDHISFTQSLFIGSFIILLLSGLYFFTFTSSKKRSLFLCLVIFDLVINSWLLLPFTGVGKSSTQKMQSIIEKSPDGFPIPGLATKVNTPKIIKEEEILIGNWAWYSKEINHNRIDYPSQLISTSNFFNSKETINIIGRPLVFTKNGSEKFLSIQSFSPNCIKVKFHVSKSDTLVLMQNNFPGWQVRVDGKKAHISTYFKTFISIPIQMQNKTADFYFLPFFK